MLCLKFDGTLNVSLFVILIPLWIIVLPLFVYTIMKGLAAINSRANKCEKVFLSVLVPSNFIFNYTLGGFIISFIMAIHYAEN